ncbi:hypothetical protein BKA67DRAFT_532421 [Truncatella angustata]|uniref:Uncharacterized protein n=1 Tax=Truncatella angustata TaxID=152316 RepID=A0A9P8ZZF8_9PEZI|nr:uncharacterized protein BKA67DRAFT_532421 [Truncatella angustata]KAH6657197.1 hypothetical protein BKA67DRAFT_532421 [Truncatella angustata]
MRQKYQPDRAWVKVVGLSTTSFVTALLKLHIICAFVRKATKDTAVLYESLHALQLQPQYNSFLQPSRMLWIKKIILGFMNDELKDAASPIRTLNWCPMKNGGSLNDNGTANAHFELANRYAQGYRATVLADAAQPLCEAGQFLP